MAQMLTYIVGSQYRVGAREAIKELRKGEELSLRREPDNPHDRNAVAVYDVCGQHLGYVPRQDAGAIAKVLDRGLPCTAKCRMRGTTSIDISWETQTYEQRP